MKKKLFALIMCLLISPSSYSAKPEQILGNDQNETITRGIKIRKGTIGALIVNTTLINKKWSENSLSKEEKTALKDLRSIIKSAYATGLFDMLPLKGWLSDESRPGNILVAATALQEVPSLMTPSLKTRIRELSVSQPRYVARELNKLL